MPAASKTSMAYPFSRLQTDGFWHRIVEEGYDPKIEYNIKSMARLRKVIKAAEMDDELFLLMCNPEHRNQLRKVLTDTYFAKEIRPVLFNQGNINLAAYKFSKELLKEVKESVFTWEEDEGMGIAEKIRDQGFRKAIVTLYDHRCSLCGIRMLTPEGHTVVEAAHIKPWSESHDDRPTNGLALCRLCHWSFDEGLMSVGSKYEVLVSKRVQIENNLPGHILTLSDRNIFTPDERKFWPDQDNFAYHREKKFMH